MKWNGIVSQREKTRMQSRLAAEKTPHTRSTQATRQGQPKPSRAAAGARVTGPPTGWRRPGPRAKGSPDGSECHSPAGRAVRSRERPASSGSMLPASRRELVSLTTHRLDQAEAELGAEPPDADVHDVGAGIEVVPPHGREQLPLGHRLAHMFHQLAE